MSGIESDSSRPRDPVSGDRIIGSKKYDLSVSGVLFQKIKFMLSLCFSSFLLSFCLRSCNKVALWFP